MIEAHGLPEMVSLEVQAKLILQGPTAMSAAETRTLKDTQDPFWNEKFVFSVEDDNRDTTFISAEVVTKQDDNSLKLGTIQPLPVSMLLNGQKMSLPTVNQGNYIYCIDGWFEFLSGPPGVEYAAMTPTKNLGKSQIHLRITYIPSMESWSSPSRSPLRSPMPATPPPAVEEIVERVAAPAPAPAPVRQAPPPPSPPPQSIPAPAQPRVLETQEANVPRRPTRERTPLPVKGGPADVGIILKGGNADGALVVDQIIPGGPASEGGQIQPGDAFIDVDGYDVVGRPVSVPLGSIT